MAKSRNWEKFGRLWHCSLIVVFLVTINFVLMPSEGLALLRQHHETPGVFTLSFSGFDQKMIRGLAWQVVLYKKNNPGVAEDIICVGRFPGRSRNFSPPTVGNFN